MKGNLLTSSNKSVADHGFHKGDSNCVLVILMRKGERANFDNTSLCLTVKEFIKAHPHVLQVKWGGEDPPSPIFLKKSSTKSHNSKHF